MGILGFGIELIFASFQAAGKYESFRWVLNMYKICTMGSDGSILICGCDFVHVLNEEILDYVSYHLWSAVWDILGCGVYKEDLCYKCHFQLDVFLNGENVKCIIMYVFEVLGQAFEFFFVRVANFAVSCVICQFLTLWHYKSNTVYCQCLQYL